jgi:hypothetical protein
MYQATVLEQCVAVLSHGVGDVPRGRGLSWWIVTAANPWRSVFLRGESSEISLHKATIRWRTTPGSCKQKQKENNTEGTIIGALLHLEVPVTNGEHQKIRS